MQCSLVLSVPLGVLFSLFGPFSPSIEAETKDDLKKQSWNCDPASSAIFRRILRLSMNSLMMTTSSISLCKDLSVPSGSWLI